jgi:hypothetical protein
VQVGLFVDAPSGQLGAVHAVHDVGSGLLWACLAERAHGRSHDAEQQRDGESDGHNPFHAIHVGPPFVVRSRSVSQSVKASNGRAADGSFIAVE